MSAPSASARLLFSLANVCILCPAPALQAQAQAQKEMPITTSSEEALALFYQGRNLSENSEDDAARVVLDQAVTKDPSFAMAHRLLAAILGGSGDDKAAREHLDKALAQMDKLNPGEKLWLASTRAGMDANYVELVRRDEELARMFPGDKHVLYMTGQAFRRVKKDYPEAYAYYHQALALDPAFAPALNGLGYVCVNMGKYEEADKAFQDQIKALPGRPNPHDSYAEFLLGRGRYDEAIAQSQQSLDADPAFLWSYEHIGDSYVFKGERPAEGVVARQPQDHAGEYPHGRPRFRLRQRIAGRGGGCT